MASSDCSSVRFGAIAQINSVRKWTKGGACRSNRHTTTSNCSVSASWEHLTFAAKLEIGVRSQESGARRKEEEGRRKEPEEVLLQI